MRVRLLLLLLLPLLLLACACPSSGTATGDAVDAPGAGADTSPVTPTSCGECEVPTTEGCVAVGITQCGDG